MLLLLLLLLTLLLRGVGVVAHEQFPQHRFADLLDDGIGNPIAIGANCGASNGECVRGAVDAYSLFILGCFGISHIYNKIYLST